MLLAFFSLVCICGFGLEVLGVTLAWFGVDVVDLLGLTLLVVIVDCLGCFGFIFVF